VKPLRRLSFGLATLAGRPRGWFIPYRYRAGARPSAYPALAPLFESARPAWEGVLETMAALVPALQAITSTPGGARFDQEWFATLDAAASYTIVRRHAPARIVEIGSGHSTRFLARAVRDAGLATAITCIDPAPRAPIDKLGVRHIASVLAGVEPDLITRLAADDVLFIDSSHIAMPGSDVDALVLDILPRLAGGVLVHFHDIFLPDPYPADWSWRGYNEQLLIGALLQGGAWEIVFPSRWLETRHPDRLTLLCDLPRIAGLPSSSLWLRKR
jgi:hypothetical protein